jgi:hypothetical protein
MKINGNDLILLGLCFGIAGTIILGKGYVFKKISDIEDESASYYGANPYAVRNRIIQKWEGITGLILIVPSAILQLLGIYYNFACPKTESLFLSPPYNLILLVLLTICIFWSSNLIASFIAKQNYIPVLRSSLEEGFKQTEYVLRNDGIYENERERSNDIKRDARDKRLADMQGRLKNWERLFNFNRKDKENNLEYFCRLKEYLEKY